MLHITKEKENKLQKNGIPIKNLLLKPLNKKEEFYSS